MTDLISRRAAIDAIDKNREALLSSGMTGAEHILVHYGRRAIEELPSAEQRRGKWIYHGDKGVYGVYKYECDQCKGYVRARYNYCPVCGAKMDEVSDDWEEPEINPCRGCDDYDGRGGCKSHGGCGAERE